MGVVQKMSGADAVVAHQPQQGGTVTIPIVLAQCAGGLVGEVQVLDDVVRHGLLVAVQKRAQMAFERAFLANPEKAALSFGANEPIRPRATSLRPVQSADTGGC